MPKAAFPRHSIKEEIAMQKSIAMPTAAVALAVAAWCFMPPQSYQAAAQSGQFFVNVVDLDIVATDRDKFLALAKDNGATAVKEPGCHEFNIAASQKDPNHVVLFEIWENAAALDAHRASDHFKAYQSATKDMVSKRELRPMWSIALNGHSPAQAGLLINAIDLDIVPAQFDAFMAAAKINGAATPSDPGAHEFNIVVSQKDPHHVLFYEVYDNAAAVEAHRATEHFKTYQAATKDMVANRNANPLSSIAMNRQPM
jgi:(4S)-4-hydroxy-5-phosphonooxypentane-2,3-dione isomerase